MAHATSLPAARLQPTLDWGRPAIRSNSRGVTRRPLRSVTIMVPASKVPCARGSKEAQKRAAVESVHMACCVMVIAAAVYACMSTSWDKVRAYTCQADLIVPPVPHLQRAAQHIHCGRRPVPLVAAICPALLAIFVIRRPRSAGCLAAAAAVAAAAASIARCGPRFINRHQGFRVGGAGRGGRPGRGVWPRQQLQAAQAVLLPEVEPLVLQSRRGQMGRRWF